MMKYKIEICQYHAVVKTYENDDVNEVLKWYRENWRYQYECGNCAFNLYENNELLDFDKEYELGFHKDSWED